jgi:hypothetical protein
MGGYYGQDGDAESRAVSIVPPQHIFSIHLFYLLYAGANVRRNE